MLINTGRIFKFNIILEKENLRAVISVLEMRFQFPFCHTLFFLLFNLFHKNSMPHLGSFVAHSKKDVA